jgi:hypothetical protein
MYRPMRRVVRQKRNKEKRIAAQIEAQVKAQLKLTPEELKKLAERRKKYWYGRPAHYGKPESYYRRHNTPKHLRKAA